MSPDVWYTTFLVMIYNKISASTRPRQFEVLTDVVITVPNATLSIKEILRRQMQGLPLPQNLVHDVQYSENFIPPYARKGFDLADVSSVYAVGRDAERRLSQEVKVTPPPTEPMSQPSDS